MRAVARRVTRHGAQHDMLAGTDRDEEGQDAAAAAAYDRVLALTSEVRAALDDDAPVGVDTLAALVGRLIDAGERAGLPPLARSAHGLGDLARAAADATALRRAVGLVEQVLDGCRSGADAGLLERLSGAASGREIGLEHDDDDEWAPAGAAAVAPPRRAASAPGGEPTLIAAFAVEALESLDRCEDCVLRYELEPGDDTLGEVRAELTTIADAAAAVGIDDTTTTAGLDVDTLLEAIDALRERIETAWAAADAGPVDAAATLALEELFLRLRRVGRDVARRQGGLLALDTHGGENRITIGLAGRIFDPLAQMIADAAARVAPDALESLRIRAERDPQSLSLTIEPPGAAAGDHEESEALHWIDARRPASETEVDRLRYRPGAVNVVQVMLA
jgi:hypothetical protein